MYIEPRRGSIRHKAQKITTRPVPPPIGGLNTRDPLSAMEPTDAIVLDNFTPMAGKVQLRPGRAAYATGISGLYTETLMTYASPSATKLFAAAETVIWDVSTTGTATSSLTSLTNGRWEWVQFTIPSASYLACVNNSADGMRYYNGTAWATATLTGTIDATKLASISSHMNRIWLVEDESLDIYYLGLQAIQGAATKLETSSQFTKGGKVMAVATWTRDGGAGMDDVLAIITSRGEVLIYAGTDPDDPATWSKVGLFSIPRPISRRCAIKFGGDVCILTVQGLIPMSEVLQRADSNQAAVAITDKIGPSIADAAVLFGENFGWQVIEYPRRNLLLINVPVTERATSYQYVMNTKTGAWGRWKALNAGCWGLSGDTIYLGLSDGTVSSLDDINDDEGEPIDALVVQAYNTYGDASRKRWVRYQPQMSKPKTYRPLVDVLMNFSPEIPDYTAPAAVASGWEWDITDWDDLEWGPENASTFDWLSIRGHGVAGALVLCVSGETAIEYNGGLVAYEAGGVY